MYEEAHKHTDTQYTAHTEIESSQRRRITSLKSSAVYTMARVRDAKTVLCTYTRTPYRTTLQHIVRLCVSICCEGVCLSGEGRVKESVRVSWLRERLNGTRVCSEPSGSEAFCVRQSRLASGALRTSDICRVHALAATGGFARDASFFHLPGSFDP